jgi:hypothetical protein
MKLSTIASALIGIAITTFAPIAQANDTTRIVSNPDIIRYAQKTDKTTKTGTPLWCIFEETELEEKNVFKELGFEGTEYNERYSWSNDYSGKNYDRKGKFQPEIAMYGSHLTISESNSLCDRDTELFISHPMTYKGYSSVIYESFASPNFCFGSPIANSHKTSIQLQGCNRGAMYDTYNDKFAFTKIAVDKFLKKDVEKLSSLSERDYGAIGPKFKEGDKFKIKFSSPESSNPFVTSAFLYIGNSDGLKAKYNVTGRLLSSRVEDDAIFNVLASDSFEFLYGDQIKDGEEVFLFLKITFFDGRVIERDINGSTDFN